MNRRVGKSGKGTKWRLDHADVDGKSRWNLFKFNSNS